MAACRRVAWLSLVGLALIGGSIGACRQGPNDAIQWPPSTRSAGTEVPAGQAHDAADAPRAPGDVAATVPVATTTPPTTTPPTMPVASPPASWPPQPPTVETDWCIDGIRALDEGSCYVLPDAPSRTLLIYLHGIVPPAKQSPEKARVQTIIANASRRAGVVALIPRGKEGFAPRGRETWIGWPTTQPAYLEHAAAFVATFLEERKKLEELIGTPFSRLYVAGSSSGAYFATRLALNGGLDADGFGAMSGGSGADLADVEGRAPKPFYIGYGKYDRGVRAAARALGELLRQAHWPVRVAEHPVDHGAREVYLDEAFAFWREHAE
jgi:predicted esterase